MKRKLAAGLTSVTLPIFVQDVTSTTGAGLGALTSGTAGLVGEYRRQGENTWTVITLAAGTLGTWSPGGWAADGALAGAYEVGLPDAVCAVGARWAAVRYRGAANMLPVLIEVELDAVNYQDATRFGLTALPNAAANANGGLPILSSGATTLAYTVTTATTTTNLTNLPAAPTDWLTAAGVKADAVTKIQAGLLTSLGNNAPAGWLDAAAFATAALNGKGDWLPASGYTAPPGDYQQRGVAVTLPALPAVTVADKTGFSLAASGFDAVKGWGTWSARQTIQAIFQFLAGKRTGVPPAGSGGSPTYHDNANVSYGSITVDTAGNITASNLTPPA